MTHHDPNAKPEVDAIRTAMREALDGSGVSQNVAAREAGISAAVLSQFLGETYPGDNDKVAEALDGWLQARVRREALPEIVTGAPFLKTRASDRVLTALGMVHDAGGIVLVTGKPGVGKTFTAREYWRRARNVWHLEVLEGTDTPVKALRHVTAALGIAHEPNWGVMDLHFKISGTLAGKRALLVIDEAQHLTRPALDGLRQLHDATDMGLALMGHPDLSRTVSTMPQLKSRLSRRVRLGAADPRGDVAVIAAQFGVEGRNAIDLLTSFAVLEGGLRNVVRTLRNAFLRAYGRAIEMADIADAWHELELGEDAS